MYIRMNTGTYIMSGYTTKDKEGHYHFLKTLNDLGDSGKILCSTTVA